jgi:hypothetical protein
MSPGLFPPWTTNRKPFLYASLQDHSNSGKVDYTHHLAAPRPEPAVFAALQHDLTDSKANGRLGEKSRGFPAMSDTIEIKHLSRTAEQVESPDWHREALEETERRLEAGQESTADWHEAKKKLRRQFK